MTDHRPSPHPLSTEEIGAALDERLDIDLDPSLAERRINNRLAEALALLDREQQEFVLRWVSIIAQTHAEMAYQFAAHAPAGLKLMSQADIEDWIMRAMDVFDRMGLFPAISVFREAERYAEEARANASGIGFDDVSGVLELFVRGLSGRGVKLEPGDDTYTDTTTLFLPQRVSRFAQRERNFVLYKAMAAHLWAQTWFGTFRVDLTQALAHYPDASKATQLFHALETVRLDACIARELPGLHRDLASLREELKDGGYPAAWAPHITTLQQPSATADTTLAIVQQLYATDVPPPLCYQGGLFPDRADAAIAIRLAREKDQFRTALARMAEEKDREDKDGEQAEAENTETEEPGKRFDLKREPDPEHPDNFTFEMQLDGQPVSPPADVISLMDSIIQDLGEIPDDYLVAAGDGGYRTENEEKNPDDVWQGTYHEEGAHIYQEWDHRRLHYRKHWCALREIDVHPVDDPFVARTRQKYAPLIAQLRKSFEALRGDEKLLKKQKNGDNIDFDAYVEAYADMQHGMELSERVLTKLQKHERNIAVMFMVDMSGSTKGWINDAERESLVLLCEALEVLGDRYAIYGFSGMTRKRCELYRVKRFDEPYSDLVRARITGIKPKDYTRMGVTIRHLSKLLNEVDARTKLLITLSDGKPDDYDGYRGDYGIEDTRKALVEAKRDGIHPFCITIDSEARDYLPHMYGPVNWTLIDDVKKLPLKVSDIYRRLTT
jgi:nitric oxide reductase NorD protein